MNDSLFTIMLDLQSGTYITQLFSDTPANALKAWCVLKHEGISAKERETVYASISESDTPTLIGGLDNIWCYLTTTEKGDYLFHVIRTVASH